MAELRSDTLSRHQGCRLRHRLHCHATKAPLQCSHSEAVSSWSSSAHRATGSCSQWTTRVMAQGTCFNIFTIKREEKKENERKEKEREKGRGEKRGFGEAGILNCGSWNPGNIEEMVS